MWDDEESRLVIWGVFSRGLGVVLLIALGGAWDQILPHIGSKGCDSIAAQLAMVRRDFAPKSALKRFLYSPTVFWLNDSDAFLRGVNAIGILAALSIIVGGAHVPYAFALCYAIYLSIDRGMRFEYPWECLLFELTWMGAFLPATRLGAVSMTALPGAHLAFAYRWLVFRVMFGFGKVKFSKATNKDKLYIREFFINQPMPTILGWLGNKLPVHVHKVNLLVMFIVEIPVPFLFFLCGWPRQMAGLLTIGLMAGIQATGNFGFFNVGTAVACIPLLDGTASVLDLALLEPLTAASRGDIMALFPLLFTAFVTLGGLVNLPFNSWVQMSWLYFPKLSWRPHWLLSTVRFLHPFRLTHAFGVFPPDVIAPIRVVPVIQGSNDGGRTWKDYEYRYLTTNAKRFPPFVAPYHPRLDHANYYIGMGITDDLIQSLFNGRPYNFSQLPTIERVCMRLLEGGSPMRNMFHVDPFPDSPPDLVRVNLYSYCPTTWQHFRATGEYWDRQLVGPHTLPMRKDESKWADWLPGPHALHPDAIVWRKRAVAHKPIKAAADLAASAHDAHQQGAAPTFMASLTSLCSEAGEAGVRAFFNECELASPLLKDEKWGELVPIVRGMKARRSSKEQRQDRKILGVATSLLAARLEDAFWSAQLAKSKTSHVMHNPSVDRSTEGIVDQVDLKGLGLRPLAMLRSYVDLHLLAHSIIAQGPAACEELWQGGEEAATKPLLELRRHTGLCLLTVFMFEMMAGHARATRILLQTTHGLNPMDPLLPGFMRHVHWLADRKHLCIGDEVVPRTVKPEPHGAWKVFPKERRNLSEYQAP